MPNINERNGLEIGSKWGCWTVAENISTAKGITKVGVRCDCGNTTTVRAADLVAGRTKMCRSCSSTVARKGHGGAKKGHVTSEYTSYTHMLQRCTNPESKDYPNYGGRGITVYELWLHSYEAFLMYMGKKPDPTYTIERLDSNGNYTPGNVVWATKETQNRNRRCNVFATIDGTRATVSEWIIKMGLEEYADCVYKRINRGMHPEEALTKKVLIRARKSKGNMGSHTGD
jgi:hypothetical protein